MTSEHEKIHKKANPFHWMFFVAIGIICGIFLVSRIFFYDFYSVPSGNMIPSINVGDFVIVNKYIYRDAADENSNSKPERGEIIAFHPPHSPKTTYLKRVIGIPGDTITFYEKQLTINGNVIATKNVDDIIRAETLGEHTYQVRYQNEQNPYRDFSGTVPANHYFVMGDNRDNSLDSREWGFLSAESLVGKVVSIF